MMKNLGIKGLLSAAVISMTLGFASAETESAVDLTKFRFDVTEMQDIASETKLPHRVFYAKPSEGDNAAWFDAVKQGNLAQVKAMVANGQDIEVKDKIGRASCRERV